MLSHRWKKEFALTWSALSSLFSAQLHKRATTPSHPKCHQLEEMGELTQPQHVAAHRRFSVSHPPVPKGFEGHFYNKQQAAEVAGQGGGGERTEPAAGRQELPVQHHGSCPFSTTGSARSAPLGPVPSVPRELSLQHHGSCSFISTILPTWSPPVAPRNQPRLCGTVPRQATDRCWLMVHHQW